MVSEILVQERRVLGDLDAVWASVVTDTVKKEFNTGRTIWRCRPWREGERFFGPQDLVEAISYQQRREGCWYHNHKREDTGQVRPIWEPQSEQLVAITERVRKACEHLPEELEEIEVEPGEDGLSFQLTCLIRQDHHLHLLQVHAGNRDLGLTLKQRSLAVVGETLVARQPRVISGGRRTCGVRQSGPEGDTEDSQCGQQCWTAAGREACRWRGKFADPGVTELIRPLGLPQRLGQELSEYLCGARPDCAYYRRPHWTWLGPPANFEAFWVQVERLIPRDAQFEPFLEDPARREIVTVE